MNAIRYRIYMSLLPERVDNTYRGHQLALWLYGLLLFVKGVMSLNSIFNSRLVASSADGIPLDAFTPAAAQTVVSLFALQALSRFILVLLGLLVLVRYRALIPFMFALLLLEHLSRRLLVSFLPIPRTGTPPASAINLGILGLTIVGLVLSLWRQRLAGQE